MKAPALTFACVAAVLLAAASAHAQTAGNPPSGSTAPPGALNQGTTGLSTNTPGTNSLGTAQSSARGGGGQGAASVGDDPAIQAEDRKVDQAVKSICRGC